MDAVLGLSMSPTTVGFVLVEGQDADGATIEHDAFAVPTDGRANALANAIAAARGYRLQSIGVTWSDDAGAEAALLLESLNDSGFDNVVPVRLPEATDALARGIAEVIGYETTAVCVIEPDTAIVLIVNTFDGSVQTAVNHTIPGDDHLIGWLSAVFARVEWAPEALVVVGSVGDLDEMMPELEEALAVPVFAPAEAELALARGAALASAQNMEFSFADLEGEPYDVPDTRRRWPLSHVGAVTMLVRRNVDFRGLGFDCGQPAANGHRNPSTARATADRRNPSLGGPRASRGTGFSASAVCSGRSSATRAGRE